MEWIVFSYKEKELLKISLDGYFPGELEATKELLAEEKGIDQSEIKIKGIEDGVYEILKANQSNITLASVKDVTFPNYKKIMPKNNKKEIGNTRGRNAGYIVGLYARETEKGFINVDFLKALEDFDFKIKIDPTTHYSAILFEADTVQALIMPIKD